MSRRAVWILMLWSLAGCSDTGGDGNGNAAASGAGSNDGGRSGSAAAVAGNGDAGSTGGNSGMTGSGTSGTGASSAGAGAGAGAGGASAGGGGADGAAGASAGDGGSGSGDAGSGGDGGAGATAGMSAPPPTAPMSFEDTQQAIEEYAAAHPGMDGDILGKTPEQLAADPAAQALYDLCGEGAVPVIPQLVWEYGGGDHAWVNPEMSALVYCVYLPVAPNGEHWSYDETDDHVTVDVFVLFPEDNPCADQTGADQITMCIGDASNFEILVDTASMNDGHDVGLELSEASTDLYLVMPDGERLHLFFGA